ncbi:MAG: hypothetical protein ABEJ24_02805 [Candidatus Magasanikbacteria bacterium]
MADTIDDLIDNISDLYHEEKIDEADEIILPPGEVEIEPGEQNWEQRDVIPRTDYVRQVLSDLGISNYELIIGQEPTANMVRNEPYQCFILPDQNKLVFVNDEEHEATFVVYEFDPEQEDIESTFRMDKQELQQDEHPTNRIKYYGEDHYKQKVKQALLKSGGEIREEQASTNTESEDSYSREASKEQASTQKEQTSKNIESERDSPGEVTEENLDQPLDSGNSKYYTVPGLAKFISKPSRTVGKKKEDLKEDLDEDEYGEYFHTDKHPIVGREMDFMTRKCALEIKKELESEVTEQNLNQPLESEDAKYYTAPGLSKYVNKWEGTVRKKEAEIKEDLDEDEYGEYFHTDKHPIVGREMDFMTRKCALEIKKELESEVTEQNLNQPLESDDAKYYTNKGGLAEELDFSKTTIAEKAQEIKQDLDEDEYEEYFYKAPHPTAGGEMHFITKKCALKIKEELESSVSGDKLNQPLEGENAKYYTQRGLARVINSSKKAIKPVLENLKDELSDDQQGEYFCTDRHPKTGKETEFLTKKCALRVKEELESEVTEQNLNQPLESEDAKYYTAPGLSKYVNKGEGTVRKKEAEIKEDLDEDEYGEYFHTDKHPIVGREMDFMTRKCALEIKKELESEVTEQNLNQPLESDDAEYYTVSGLEEYVDKTETPIRDRIKDLKEELSEEEYSEYFYSDTQPTGGKIEYLTKKCALEIKNRL